MSPDRRSEIKSATFVVSVATLVTMIVAAIIVGRQLERVNVALSESVAISDMQIWVAYTERGNTNWNGADIRDIWERNHAERKSIIGRVP